MSNRNEFLTPIPNVDSAILDAARACIEEFGVKRTTLAEVARRAGVSRPTVYRRWPDMRALLGELLTREMHAAIVPAELAGPTSRDRTVQLVVHGARALRTHPMFVKVFRTDPDLMVTYTFERLGRSQRELIRVFVEVIKDGQRDGSVRAGDPGRMAAMLLLIVQSSVQSASIVSELLDDSNLDDELAFAVDGYLREPGT